MAGAFFVGRHRLSCSGRRHRLKYRISLVLGLSSALCVCATVTPSHAYDWIVETTVTVVEPSYMPTKVSFQAGTAGGSCAGQWLSWYAKGSDQAAQIANTQSVLATLISAQLSGKSVRIFGNNNECTIDFIHLIG